MNLDYAAGQISGAVMMAFSREGWEQRLDRSVDGVFRSFQAFLFAAPFALVGYFFLRRAAEHTTELQASALLQTPYPYMIAVEMTGFALDWAASLALLVFAARMLGAARRVGDLIIGFNWIQPAIAAAQAAPLALLSVDATGSAAAIAFFPSFAFAVALLWGVIRRSTQAGPGAAAGLILLLALTGLIVGAIVSSAAVGLYAVIGNSAD